MTSTWNTLDAVLVPSVADMVCGPGAAGTEATSNTARAKATRLTFNRFYEVKYLSSYYLPDLVKTDRTREFLKCPWDRMAAALIIFTPTQIGVE